MRKFLLFIIFIAALCSCSPRIVGNVDYQRDTIYIRQDRIDSLYLHDSVFVKDRGDTVYVYKEKIKDRYRVIHDTVRLVKVDSVAVERIKEVKVEKNLSKWQGLKIRVFPWLLGIALIFFLLTAFKFIKKWHA